MHVIKVFRCSSRDISCLLVMQESETSTMRVSVSRSLTHTTTWELCVLITVTEYVRKTHRQVLGRLISICKKTFHHFSNKFTYWTCEL